MSAHEWVSIVTIAVEVGALALVAAIILWGNAQWWP